MKQEQQEPVVSRLQRIYRRSELPAFVGLQRTVIGELIQHGAFPKPIPLSDAVGRNAPIGWLESDLVAWQNARIGKRNAAVEHEGSKPKKAKRR